MLLFLLCTCTAALAGIGGLYYSFACAVMPGLRAVDDTTFIRAMQEINSRIQNPWFALSFVGSFLALGATGIYTWTNGIAVAAPVTLAFALYCITLAITFGCNIPLNNRLVHDATPGNEKQARLAFEARWTRWNVYRSWISAAAIVSLCFAWR